MSYYFGEPNDEGGTSLNGLSALSVIIFWFVWIVLSDYFFGRSFGNWACDLKPVPIENPGYPLSFGQCVVRHIFDGIDISWVGLLLIILDDKNRRLGDIVGKTMVVTTK